MAHVRAQIMSVLVTAVSLVSSTVSGPWPGSVNISWMTSLHLLSLSVKETVLTKHIRNPQASLPWMQFSWGPALKSIWSLFTLVDEVLLYCYFNQVIQNLVLFTISSPGENGQTWNHLHALNSTGFHLPGLPSCFLKQVFPIQKK